MTYTVMLGREGGGGGIELFLGEYLNLWNISHIIIIDQLTTIWLFRLAYDVLISFSNTKRGFEKNRDFFICLYLVLAYLLLVPWDGIGEERGGAWPGGGDIFPHSFFKHL